MVVDDYCGLFVPKAKTMTRLQFRLPDTTDRRQPPDRRQPAIRIDSRQSLIHPTYTIKIPVLRNPVIYDWAAENE